MLASAASADIVIAFYPETRMDAGKQYVVFRISAIDVSTNKSVYSMSAQGTATYGSGQMVNQLKEAILNVKDEFLNSLQSTFNDMQKKGREVRITLQRKESCPINFAKRYDGEPLSELISDWLDEHVQTPGFTSGRNNVGEMLKKGLSTSEILGKTTGHNEYLCSNGLIQAFYTNDIKTMDKAYLELAEKYNIPILNLKGKGIIHS